MLTGRESNNTANLSKRKPRMDCRVKPGNDDGRGYLPRPRHCEEQRDEAIQLPAQALDCFAAARNDACDIALATLARPSSPHHNAKCASTKKGGEAPRGACQPCPRSSDECHHSPMPSARLRAALGGAPAFRRFTAALTNGFYPDGSAPEPGFLKARRNECFARSPHNALS
jgi:hypothetical protein